jgi:Fe2+ or Zn2+ uptake regulation protein
MVCVHLRKLYQLCQDENIQLSSSDLIHIVCEQCGVKDVCPSALIEQLESDENPSAESHVPISVWGTVACVGSSKRSPDG